jgi:hypothetical protein
MIFPVRSSSWIIIISNQLSFESTTLQFKGYLSTPIIATDSISILFKRNPVRVFKRTDMTFTGFAEAAVENF